MTAITIPGHGEIDVPAHVIENIGTAHGHDNVRDWLDGLGALLGEVLARFDARLVPGDPPLSYHLVLFAETRGGSSIVIKSTAPNAEQPSELAAVEALSRASIGPRLLWHDLGSGVIVMERVVPGETLPTDMPTLAEDAEITRTVAALATRIAHESDLSGHRLTLVPVRVYSKALGEVDPASELWERHHEDIERALALRDSLMAEDRRGVVLHGDLHHYNILRDDRADPCVIDPKGLVGPPGYEVGAFLYNPVGIQHHREFAAIAQQRVAIWAEVTGLPWETVRSWGYVAAVLSACWSGQGSGIGWTDAMTVAVTLRDLAPLS